MTADKRYMYMNKNYKSKNGNAKQKNKITAMILCTLGFLGFAGLHRIYAGKKISGILFFVTLGFLGLGTMFDLICIVFDKFSDSENRKLTVE